MITKILQHARITISTFSLLSLLITNLFVHAGDLHNNQAYVHIPSSTPKKWTVIVYMAADNDLRGFAARNIKQMAAVGSNEFINILVHLDIKISGNKKITRRYYIEKNRILHVNGDDPTSQKMDSGDPQTLVSCCAWAINDYPAENYGLILWNHGTGPIDPSSGRIINPTELFSFNPESNKFELSRTMGFLDYINARDAKDRGICWDDTTGNYLNNQKLVEALEEIQRDYLQGGKLSLIGFDACLMSTLEIANLVKKYAKVMVGSQEVELGTGWNYQRVLSPFQTQTLDANSFSQHIVQMYGATYSSIIDVYTLSAIDLGAIDDLEDNINAVANLLIDCLKSQKGNSVKSAIEASRNSQFCTYFDEPSYLDLHHLYSNLQANLVHFSFNNNRDEQRYKPALEKALREGQKLIKRAVKANIVGKERRLAQGLSIYFPERRIHYSYKRTPFAENNAWYNFLMNYLAL